MYVPLWPMSSSQTCLMRPVCALKFPLRPVVDFQRLTRFLGQFLAIFPFPCSLRKKKLGYSWQTAQRIDAVCIGVADPHKHAPPHMCYHVEFGRSASKNVGINGGNPPKLRSTGACPFGMEVWLTPRNMPFPPHVAVASLFVLCRMVQV